MVQKKEDIDIIFRDFILQYKDSMLVLTPKIIEIITFILKEELPASEWWRMVHLFGIFHTQIYEVDPSVQKLLKLLESSNEDSSGLTGVFLALWYMKDSTAFSLKRLQELLISKDTDLMTKSFTAYALKQRYKNSTQSFPLRDLLGFLKVADPLSAQVVLKILGEIGTSEILPELGMILIDSPSGVTKYWIADTISRIKYRDRQQEKTKPRFDRFIGFLKVLPYGKLAYFSLLVTLLGIMQLTGLFNDVRAFFNNNNEWILVIILLMVLIQIAEAGVILEVFFSWIQRLSLVLSLKIADFIKKNVSRDGKLTKILASVLFVCFLPYNQISPNKRFQSRYGNIDCLSYYAGQDLSRTIEKVGIRIINFLVAIYVFYLICCLAEELFQLSKLILLLFGGNIIIELTITVSVFLLDNITWFLVFDIWGILSITLFFYGWFENGVSLRIYPYGKPKEKRPFFRIFWLCIGVVVSPIIVLSNGLTLGVMELESFFKITFHLVALSITLRYLLSMREIKFNYTDTQKLAYYNPQFGELQNNEGQLLELSPWFSQIEGITVNPVFLASYTQIEGEYQSLVKDSYENPQYGFFKQDPEALSKYGTLLITPGKYVGRVVGYSYKIDQPGWKGRDIPYYRFFLDNYTVENFPQLYLAILNPNADMSLKTRKEGEIHTLLEPFGDWYYSRERNITGFIGEAILPPKPRKILEVQKEK